MCKQYVVRRHGKFLSHKTHSDYPKKCLTLDSLQSIVFKPVITTVNSTEMYIGFSNNYEDITGSVKQALLAPDQSQHCPNR